VRSGGGGNTGDREGGESGVLLCSLLSCMVGCLAREGEKFVFLLASSSYGSCLYVTGSRGEGEVRGEGRLERKGGHLVLPGAWWRRGGRG